MTIGQLYNAKNVVVGQAACLLAPAYTPLPPAAAFNLTDPFSLEPWGQWTLIITGSTSITLTYTPQGGTAQTTSSLTVAGLTKAQIKTALENLSSIGSGNAAVGGSASPWAIALSQSVQPGTLTVTPTGGTASVLSNLWNALGATDAGWKFTANKSTTDINIEEQSAPVATTMGSQKITVEGALAEDIEETLAIVYNMTQTFVAAASGIPGYNDLTLTDDVLNYACALIMANKNKMPRVLYIPSTVSLSNADTSLKRASAKRMYPIVLSSTCATEEIKIRNFTNVALP